MTIIDTDILIDAAIVVSSDKLIQPKTASLIRVDVLTPALSAASSQ